MSDQPQAEQQVEEPIEILIEFPDRGGLVPASLGDRIGEMQAVSEKAWNVVRGSIREMAYKVSGTVKELGQDVCPDEVEFGFSLKVDLEGGTVVPVVAQTTVGGQFSIKFTWKLERPEQVKVLVSPNA
jgi:hypothetical protein